MLIVEKCQNRLCSAHDCLEPSGCYNGAEAAAKCPERGSAKRMKIVYDDYQRVAL